MQGKGRSKESSRRPLQTRMLGYTRKPLTCTRACSHPIRQPIAPAQVDCPRRRSWPRTLSRCRHKACSIMLLLLSLHRERPEASSQSHLLLLW